MSRTQLLQQANLCATSVVLAICFATAILADQPEAGDHQTMTIHGQLRILDGDTFEIGPILIRLHGVDAPEKAQRCRMPDGDDWPCGVAAIRRITSLIEVKAIACEARDRDPNGRIISRCSVGNIDIGATLIREGLAWAFVEYCQDYVTLERAARAGTVGIWQAPTQTPWDFRDDKWNRALAEAPDKTCPIKGNIGSGKGKPKIYHTPWSPNYQNTKIDEDKSKRRLCDEGATLAAGWRPVGRP